MAILRLVRHGEASASYDAHPDPGLSARGRAQAEAAADELEEFGPLRIVTSPMARARQTADPLARRWNVRPQVEAAVSEIPSPGLSPSQRGPWLQRIMAGTWAETTADVRAWRDDIVTALLSQPSDVVIFSHFVAINAAISVAAGHDGPGVRHLGHCSVSVFDTGTGHLRMLEAGEEGPTRIL